MKGTYCMGSVNVTVMLCLMKTAMHAADLLFSPDDGHSNIQNGNKKT